MRDLPWSLYHETKVHRQRVVGVSVYGCRQRVVGLIVEQLRQPCQRVDNENGVGRRVVEAVVSCASQSSIFRRLGRRSLEQRSSSVILHRGKELRYSPSQRMI